MHRAGLWCNNDLSNAKSEHFIIFQHCLNLSSGSSKNALGVYDKIHVVWAVSSSCPVFHGLCLALSVPSGLVRSQGTALSARSGPGLGFLFFAPCHLIIPAQAAHSLCPWQKGYFEVGGWGMLGGEGGLRRYWGERVQWTLLRAAVMSNGTGLWEPVSGGAICG